MSHTVGGRVAHSETISDGNPEPVVAEGGQSVDVAGDAANLLIDLVPVPGRVLGHLDNIVGSQVGSQRKSWQKNGCYYGVFVPLNRALPQRFSTQITL